MNPLLQVTERDIELLNEYQFVDVLNRLLKAEAYRYGIPQLAVKTTLRIHDSDGGIDARIEHSTKIPTTCRIPEGFSVWQYKTGDVEPKEIREIESQKPGVQNAIQVGSSYCLVIGKGCSDTQRKNREKAVNDCYHQKGLEAKGRLLTAQDVADWVSDYPAVAMLPYFNRPRHDELLTFDNWNNLPELRVGYVNFEIDDQRQAVIDELGEAIANRVGFTHIRIAGRAGIGKTRLALEAARANGLEYDTVYALSPDGIPSDLFSHVEANPNIRLVLVIDECTFEESLRRQRLAQRCGDRLLLITIGHDPLESVAKIEIPLFSLNALDNEAIQRIVRQIAPAMPIELVSFVVRASGGYVKLATAITESLARNPDFIGAAQLTGAPDVEIILESLVPDPTTRRAMEALSLLRQVGLEGEVATEGQAIARFMRVEFRELKRVAEQMRQSGLIVRRGRYCYITPHLLAVWFATKTWRVLSEDIVNDLLLAEEGLPTFVAKEALLERLADLGEEEIAAPVVEKLLGPGGLFPDIQALDHTIRSRVFATLAKAAPKRGAAALQRLLGHLPRDELSEFRAGRRQIIWTLEKMLSLEDTFWIAARLLLKLAEAENETISNNATGVWREIFYTHLSGTPIPAIKRHRLIREALDSPQIETRLLAVQAIQTSLSNYEVRSRGSNVDGYIPSVEWRPKTWGDLWETRRSALKLLDQALNNRESRVVEAAREVLIGVSRGLVAQGLVNEVLPRLQQLTLNTDSERQAMWELLQEILHYEEEVLTRMEQEAIEFWANTLIGNTFRDRLRRWVGEVSDVDYWKLQETEESLEKIAASMADEGYQNPNLLHPELEWLASANAVHFYPFGQRLGELDTGHQWLEELVAQVCRGGNPGLLTAYLQGRTVAGEIEWVEQLLDIWTKNNQEMALTVFDAIWRRGGSDSNLKRILSLVDKGWLPLITLGQLAWGGWLNSISANAMASLLQRMIKDESSEATEATLSLLLGWLKTHSQQAEAIAEYALKLLERPIALRSQGIFSFHWRKVAKFYLPSFSARIAQATLNLFFDPTFWMTPRNDRMTVLKEAALSAPETVWPLIGEVLLREDRVSYQLLLSLKGWEIEDVGTSLLLEWAEKHKPNGARVLAQIAHPLTSLSRQLLIQYGQDESIRRSLTNNFLSGSFWGSEVTWLESNLDIARKWLDDEHPTIRSWAQELVEYIEARIERARQEEEEEELIWQ